MADGRLQGKVALIAGSDSGLDPLRPGRADTTTRILGQHLATAGSLAGPTSGANL